MTWGCEMRWQQQTGNPVEALIYAPATCHNPSPYPLSLSSDINFTFMVFAPWPRSNFVFRRMSASAVCQGCVLILNTLWRKLRFVWSRRGFIFRKKRERVKGERGSLDVSGGCRQKFGKHASTSSRGKTGDKCGQWDFWIALCLALSLSVKNGRFWIWNHFHKLAYEKYMYKFKNVPLLFRNYFYK